MDNICSTYIRKPFLVYSSIHQVKQMLIELFPCKVNTIPSNQIIARTFWQYCHIFVYRHTNNSLFKYN